MFSVSSNSLNQSIKRIVTADEVERYVDKVQSRLQSPAEKKSKAFAFARLYYDAKDYETAKKYLEDYLTIQDRDFRVHNLMGQCEEAIGNNEGALSSYKKSLELCSTQNDIVVKVVSLCTKCPMDPLRAKLWADKGSRICPGHPAVFDLKWHLLENQQPKDYEEMELLLADELARRAREPSLHIKLVKLYMEAGSYKRAFLHCQSVQKTCAFDANMAWLQCACDVFDFHRQNKDEGRISASLVFALTLCKLTTLHLKNSSSRTCTAILHRFDKTVKEIISQTPQDIFDGLTPEWKDCITEMKGQLYLNVVIYIIKLAQENVISWLKAKRISVAVLMACWQIDVPQTTSKLLSRQVSYHNMHSYDWSMMACSRLSQAGHLLLYLEEMFENDWLKNCVVDICTEQGHAALLDNIYPDNVNSVDSFLAGDEEFKQTEFRMPDINDLIKYDEVSVADHATDLHHIVWLGLHWGILDEKMKPGVGVIIGRLFEGISLDVKNMNNCHHSSLCLRDIEAFIYAVIRSSKNIHLDCVKSDESLKLPPTVICERLVTEQQQDWWQAAYGLYSGKFGTQAVSKLKTIMQKGLETIRCMQNHGIDPRILIYTSLAFWEKGLSIESSKKEEYDYKDHWQSLQKRAMHYMKEALRILEIFKSNKTIPIVESPLILPLSDPLQEEEIASLLNKNYLKLAESAMLGGDLEEALKYYEEVKSLQSFYSQSQIYIRLASASDRKSVEGEKSHLLYIKKAKEKLSICINNADHSPEFKQTLIGELHELEMTAANNSHSVIPKSKKALNFQVEVPNADVGIDDSQIYTSNGEIPQEVEKSVLQEQLDAKESEIKSLKQALAMYKAHIDMQKHYQVVQPVMNQPPLILQPFPPNAQHRHIRSLDSTASNTVTPHVPNEMGTPSVPGGLETPSDMWWDSFSPQPSFEKGYFAGLAQHAQQSREEKGEGEAPTLKDSVEPSLEQQTGDSSMSLPTVDCGLVPNETFTPKDTPNISSSPAPVNIASSPAPHNTPSSPAVVPKEVLSPKTPTSPVAYEGCDIYVEPIVHLTSKSEIVTGEEGEIVKFVHRAKLFRFDKEASQWKERGLGDVKILYDEKSNKSRITMRREQVFRVCCNHFITSEMNLESKQGAKAAWSWFTPADATEAEIRPEQFTIKFKTQETADQFKEVFVECQKLSNKEVMTTPTKEETSVEPEPCSSAPAAFVNPFLNVTNISAVCPNLITPPQQSQMPPGLLPAPQFVPPAIPVQPGSFQFTFGSQDQTNSVPNNSFNGFTFQPQVVPVQGLPPQVIPIQADTVLPPTIYPAQVPDPSDLPESPNIPVIVSYVPQPVIPSSVDSTNITTISNETTHVTELTPTTFSGFSFSNNKSPEVILPSTMSSTVVETGTSEVLTNNFPMMSSLLKDSASASAPVTPEKTTVIEGMSQLPVFQKGIVDKDINPASFWSSTSPEKPFFTGNSVGLEAIGHKEEQRVPDDDEHAKENAAKVNNVPNINLMELNPPDGYDPYGYDDYDEDAYYGQNGEYYEEYYGSANEDDDDDDEEDDEIDEYGYGNGPDNQPSRASSSRRGSDDDDLDVYISEDRPVEDRFDIPKKAPNVSIIDVIDDDLVITMERVPTFAQKLKASRFQLPSTFYLHESKPPCSGCRGCIDDFDTKVVAVKVEETVAPTPPPAFPSEVSFSAIAAQGSTGFSGSTGAFSGAGAQLFAKSATNGDNEDGANTDYDPHYDAIVQLQKVEKMETGEEDDQVLFKHRAKLYRFDQKWREKGVGDMKLTRNIKTGYCRVLMRRDLIHKLCANHAIMPNMELKPLSSSDSSLVWFTPSDYSEGLPPVPQSFCVKFKSKEIAEQFKEQFQICKEHMEKILEADEKAKIDSAVTESTDERKDAENTKSESSESVLPVADAQSKKDIEEVSVKPVLDLRSKFAPKAGSWECSGCLLQNDGNVAKCPACETPNPNKPVTSENKPSQDLKSKFAPKEGSWECSGCLVRNNGDTPKCLCCDTPNPNKPVSNEPSNLRSKFAPKTGSWECSGCLVRNDGDVPKCLCCDTPNPNKPVSNEPAKSLLFGSSTNQTSAFTFGSQVTPNQTSGFSFGSQATPNQTNGFSFGSQATPNQSTGFSFGSQATPNQSTGFSFGSSTTQNQSSGFAFGSAPVSAASSSSVGSSANSSASFSFGTKTEVTPMSFVAKPEGLPSFGSKSEGTVSSFSFGTKPEVGLAAFSFGSKPNVTDAPKLNVAWGGEGSKTEFNKNQNKENVDKFAADPDTWECPSCLAKNNGCRELCRTCTVPREKTPVVTLDPSQFSTPINQQINTANPAQVNPLPFNYSPKPNVGSPFSWDASSLKLDVGLTSKEKDKELMPPPNFLPIMTKQDDKKASPKVETAKTESSWVPQGLNLSNLFSFGSTPSPSLSNASSVDDLSQVSTFSNVPAAFAGTSFTFKYEPTVTEPKTPTKNKEESTDDPASPSSPNEDNEDEDCNNSFEFSPLVSVVKIKHSSGEEDEECLFSARSKMFRFDGQWKERGVGEIKILRHLVTKQHRLIMRRDQTHKLCANHSLMKGMDIKAMSGAKKAYMWKTFADISDDGESKEQMFAARFKEEIVSDEFRDIFEMACSGKVPDLMTPAKVSDIIEIVDSDGEEEVVSETKDVDVDVEYEASIGDELKLKAKTLLLPTTFFHVPSTELGSVVNKTTITSVENGVTTINLDEDDDDTDIPHLMLTHEKVPDISMEQKSDKMLLPKGFYNFKESANLTDENVEVITDDTNIDIDELYADDTEYSSFELGESNSIVFDETCTVFRMSTKTNDYVKLKDGDLKIKEENADKRYIVLVNNEKIYFSVEVTKETVLVTRSDSKNTYDIEAINLAHKKVNMTEKFALKFQDLLTCEKFSSVIDESKDRCNNVQSKQIGPTFGSRLFGNSTEPLSFASMISNSNQSSGFKDNSGQSFDGAGKTLFGVSTNGNEEKDPAVEESNIYVEPIVQLESVETTSGEEKEWLCFNQRCRLYIFDNVTKKWKERGVGEIKLLRHKENNNARVVMRRDQVHKLCANHLLLPTTKLEPFKSKELTVTWNAIGDVSNGPAEDFVLAARFKNVTILDEFEQKFTALCNKEEVAPIVRDEPSEVVGELKGSCDPALTKSLNQVKI